MQSDQLLHERETNTQTPLSWIGLEEHLEDTRQLGLGNTDARVLHVNRRTAVLGRDRDLDGSSRRRELHGVRDEVHEYLFKPSSVRFEIEWFPGQTDVKFVTAGLRAAGLESSLQDGPKGDLLDSQFEFPTCDPIHGHEVVDEACEVVDLAVDHVVGEVHLVPGRTAAQYPNGGADGRQRVPQFVGHRGEELVLTLIDLYERLGR